MESGFQLIAAPFTPFYNDGSLNLDAVERYAHHLCENGVDGVFVCGTTGESTSLTIEERMQLATRWVEVGGHDLKVIVHVGHDCLADACALAKHAGKIGAAAIGAQSPVFFKPATAVQLVDCLEPIAAGAPQLPFYYYHMPAMTGVGAFAADFLEAADGRILNLAGVKFTDYNLVDFRACVQFKAECYDAFWGRDERLLEGLAAGARGAIGSTYNFAAPHFHRLIAAYRNGDDAQAERLQKQAVAFIEIIFHQFGGLPAAKALFSHLAVDCGPARLPLPSFTAPQFNALLEALCAVDFPGFAASQHEAEVRSDASALEVMAGG
jgi:N-acetylneuraminate lyase